jgi:hypothetical protein
MHPSEWQTTSDLDSLLREIGDERQDRKARLCAVAWVRAIGNAAHHAPTDEMVRSGNLAWIQQASRSSVLDAAEQFADAQLTAKALRDARTKSGGPWNVFRDATRITQFSLGHFRRGAFRNFQNEFGSPSNEEACDIVRDIFGQYGHSPPTNGPAWPERASLIAQSIYADGAVDRMPILADALEEAGYKDAEILAHCRGPGPHVRGCWVVDLILGKE